MTIELLHLLSLFETDLFSQIISDGSLAYLNEIGSDSGKKNLSFQRSLPTGASFEILLNCSAL
jgi:hypothetical protein